MSLNKRITKKDAEKIVTELIGEKPIMITKINNGLTHKVYNVVMQKDYDLIVRISTEESKINAFMKEQWCTKITKEHDIPTPEILEVGNSVIQTPYMVLKKNDGIAANDYSLDRAEMLKQLGKYASKIHKIRTDAYGEFFDWSQNMLSKNKTWEDYLTKELKIDEGLELFEKIKIIPKKLLKRYISIRDEFFKEWRPKPNLIHGDLVLKNLLVDKQGNILNIIDWESSLSFVDGYWEFARNMWSFSYEEKIYFLRAYGINEKKQTEIKDYVDLLYALWHLSGIKRALENNNKEALETFKQKLNNSTFPS